MEKEVTLCETVEGLLKHLGVQLLQTYLLDIYDNGFANPGGRKHPDVPPHVQVFYQKVKFGDTHNTICVEGGTITTMYKCVILVIFC